MPDTDLIRRASTLPASWYRDPEIWQQERRRIFARNWVMFGRADQAAGPGGYLAGEVAGWPVFVIRQRDGSLKGFHNVCRHRAGPLVWDGSGTCQVLRCQYHGWVYDGEGRLIRTPDFDSALDFDRSRFSLHPVAVAEWGGLIFVNLDSSAVPIGDAMAGITQELGGRDLTRFRFHSQTSHEIRCNWKTYVENYAEGYHVPTIHPGLNEEVDYRQYRVICKDGYALHQVPSKSPDPNYAGIWLWMWPNLAINVYTNGMNIEQMLPIGHDRTRLVYNFFIAEGEGHEESLANSIAFGHQVTVEDIQVCEAVQRNLESGVYETGRLNPDLENGVWFFQQMVRQALDG